MKKKLVLLAPVFSALLGCSNEPLQANIAREPISSSEDSSAQTIKNVQKNEESKKEITKNSQEKQLPSSTTTANPKVNPIPNSEIESPSPPVEAPVQPPVSDKVAWKSKLQEKDRILGGFFQFKGTYQEHPLMVVDKNSPKGTALKGQHTATQSYKGALTDYFIYVPANYKATDSVLPRLTVVFDGSYFAADGERFGSGNGSYRVPVVLDNAIAKGYVPPTIVLFLNPSKLNGNEIRYEQYDKLDNVFSNFLQKEIIPDLLKKHSLKISDEPGMTLGCSSGGTIAFTLAWKYPERYSRVLTLNGSFVPIAGANMYPDTIRKEAIKKLRVNLTSSPKDLNNEFGSWLAANAEMFKALEEKKYQVRFEENTAGHCTGEASKRWPEALLWLWQD
jgi:enterochelin esterase-like enzyme